MEHVPDKYGFKKGAELFPLMVVVEFSNVCNAYCDHCVYTNVPALRKKVPEKYALKDMFSMLAAEVAEHKSFLRITGTGEPFVHPQAMDIFLDALDKGVRLGIITNGSLLVPEKSKQLLDRGIDVLEISVDAADEKTYEIVRKGLSWKKLLTNIDFMLKYRDDNKLKSKIIVSIVDQPSKLNVPEAKAYWDKKVDYVIVRKYLTYELGEEKEERQPFITTEGMSPCPHPFERIVLLANGETRICNNDLRHGINMGTYPDQSIKEIWAGAMLNHYRKNILCGDYDKNVMCKNCTEWRYRSWNYNFFHALDNVDAKKQELQKV